MVNCGVLPREDCTTIAGTSQKKNAPMVLCPRHLLRCCARWAVLGLAAAGCGDGGGQQRQPIVGTVTLNGRPLASGALFFYAPTGEISEKGPPSVVAQIEHGRFSIPRNNGLFPARYKISISSVGTPLLPLDREARERPDETPRERPNQDARERPEPNARERPKVEGQERPDPEAGEQPKKVNIVEPKTPTKELVPAKYNIETELVVEIKRGVKELRIDLDSN
jgi:hypothetical protein